VKDRKGRSTYSHRKADPLIFGAKMAPYLWRGIWVLGTQVLDPVVEQSAQIFYRIVLARQARHSWVFRVP